MTWLEAVDFTIRLSERDGLRPCYTTEGGQVRIAEQPIAGCDGYRLPTEAEWEYAARAGGDAPWSGAADRAMLCRIANGDLSGVCTDGQSGFTRVRQLVPNAWGLYDLSGNAVEWVWDAYAPYEAEVQVDPLGGTGNKRVLRGGAYGSSPDQLRVTYRSGVFPQNTLISAGFRLARSGD